MLETKTNQNKKLSSKSKIIILAAAWILLLGGAVGLALILKPTPEVVHVDPIQEAYKYSEEKRKVTDTVDDLDYYYGTYIPDPIEEIECEDGTSGCISGLKDKTVEAKINARITEFTNEMKARSDFEYSVPWPSISANYYNVLSIYISMPVGISLYEDEGLTFDLTTGDELSFDDLFSENVNIQALLYKDFYDTIISNAKFSNKSAIRRLRILEADYTDWLYYPREGETRESLEELIASNEEKISNIEQVAANEIQKYLSGDKKFYLNPCGPALILEDGTIVEMKLGEDIRYAVYLKNYRTKESIFENPYPSEKNLLFTEKLINDY